jgi:signal transduction histidine kinase
MEQACATELAALGNSQAVNITYEFDAQPVVEDDDIRTAAVVIEVGRPNQAHAPATLHRLSSPPGAPRIDELLAAARRKDEFLAMLLHELRSPIASIQNALDILRRQSSEAAMVKDAVMQRRMHALIERQVHHITLLTGGLRDMSGMACGHLRLHRERLDLRVVVANAIETLESDLKRRGQRLEAAWPDCPVWLHADASRLEQVFVNLIGNASKYSDAGGELALSVHTSDGYAIARVRDTGIGIAPEVLPRIFDLFMQADAAAPRSRSGLGIGLALVRTLVELHDGSVSAASAGLGQGSEFTVHLPQDR